MFLYRATECYQKCNGVVIHIFLHFIANPVGHIYLYTKQLTENRFEEHNYNIFQRERRGIGNKKVQ